jgi:two-component system CheB/CheR fusion protein
LEGVSNSQLKRYFKKESGGFKICDSIRRLCIFARQNLVEDPPFLHLNIISCQNVLIYFNEGSHMRAFNWFAMGLSYGGCLILGSTESLPAHFSAFHQWQRGIPIYMKGF